MSLKKILLILAVCFCAAGVQGAERVICGYVAHSATDSINPQYVNRLIFSYMEVDSTLTGLRLKNPERLRYVASLRKNRPDLEVMVSFGGNPGLLSRAMRDDSLRSKVVGAIRSIVDEYGLDGIDVDWEFPGRGDGALTEKEDVANFVKLLSDLRKVLGEDKILTIACAGSGYGVDYQAMSQILDQFNIMAYDMGTPPSHHSALYKSERVSWLSADQSVTNFLNGRVDPAKIVLGMPFYGRGGTAYKDFTEWRHIKMPDGAKECYDAEAEVPWIADAEGNMIFSYDNPYSLKKKCEYIRQKQLAGGMYWRIEEDDDSQTLGRTVYEELKKSE